MVHKRKCHYCPSSVDLCFWHMHAWSICGSFKSPKYEFYSGSITIEENLFSSRPPYIIGYDKIQYCRPIYFDSLIASFLGEHRPKSLDDFTVMEIKLLFGKKRFIVRANPKLQDLKIFRKLDLVYDDLSKYEPLPDYIG